MNDWNASDADLKVRKPGLLGRIALTSTKASTRRALKEAEAMLIKGTEEARLDNVIGGLAERLALGPVEVYVIGGQGANAMSGRIDRPVVGVTRALLDTYARTELEAVVAHCLVRHKNAGRKGTVVGYSDDVRAVALTRYPPALASALEKATPYEGRHASHYLVAEGLTHRPVPERVTALNDL